MLGFFASPTFQTPSWMPKSSPVEFASAPSTVFCDCGGGATAKMSLYFNCRSWPAKCDFFRWANDLKLEKGQTTILSYFTKAL
ncbi:hypothetical protein Rhopal_000276-T1 [Rhodotorula paludigena]|uniref:Zinc finger GRF-type domain-containing protein n=1 Tax=Rhodotorula paludigena TaxID=86838 RepID=A0AAV5GDC3_9BASI|nr:hypothetical protein Rhopal_000276-T1 [Rhodotorula paludigena]